MERLFVIIAILLIVAAAAVMVRFRLRAWLAMTVLGLLVGAMQSFRTFFLLSFGEGDVLAPAMALIVYYGTVGLCVGAVAEFIRHLHHLTHGRKSEKDIV